MAAVKVHVGIFYVDYTTPFPNALVLHWPVFEHFQWGTAESTGSTLPGQDSPLRLHVVYVKVDSGGSSVDHTTLSQTLWCYAGLYLSTSNGAPRKVLNRPWVAKNRRSDCPWLL